RKYGDCKVHSSSPAHHRSSNTVLGIWTYPFHINPRGGLREDLFEDFGESQLEGYNNVPLVTLVSFFIRKFRLTSIIIDAGNAKDFVPIFFSHGLFQESHLVVCQEHPALRWTWESPGGQFQHEVDYVIFNRCLTVVSVVLKVYTWSDHRFLRGGFRFSRQGEKVAKFKKLSS
ncbi:unnamed protein product, partial [Heligmosomoides polygyrus]|uniref:Endo/exonuclease/phosphatase domain-containing protein n=1 Tax=Heligmosomoides polygyrus TaxID=6339 RepID=A0A183GF62_HELPZ